MTFSYGPVPDELLATAQQWREKMVSAAAEASDELMDKYLETGELDEGGDRRRPAPAHGEGGDPGGALRERL